MDLYGKILYGDTIHEQENRRSSRWQIIKCMTVSLTNGILYSLSFITACTITVVHKRSRSIKDRQYLGASCLVRLIGIGSLRYLHFCFPFNPRHCVSANSALCLNCELQETKEKKKYLNEILPKLI